MKGSIRIALAEDHLIVRQGFISLLNRIEDFKIVYDVNNGKELLDAMREERPDVVLMDIDMPVMGGRQALEIIKFKYPEVKVIMLSVHFEDSYIIEFIKNGASAFLPKAISFAKLREAIFTVNKNGHYYDEEVSQVLAQEVIRSRSKHPDKHKLTKREVDVLNLIKQNKTNAEIAHILSISTRTAEWHRSNLMEKTGSKSVEDLLIWNSQHLIDS